MTTRPIESTLTTDIIQQRTLRLAMQLPIDAFSVLSPVHLERRKRKRTDKRLRQLGHVIPGEAPLSGEYREGVPEDYKTKFEVLSEIRLDLAMARDPRFAILPLLFLLSIPVLFVIIGMSIAQIIHLASIPLSMAFSLLLLRATVQSAESVDPVLAPSMDRTVWNILSAAVVHDAVRAGELSVEADGLGDGWEASGLSWALVAGAR